MSFDRVNELYYWALFYRGSSVCLSKYVKRTNNFHEVYFSMCVCNSRRLPLSNQISLLGLCALFALRQMSAALPPAVITGMWAHWHESTALSYSASLMHTLYSLEMVRNSDREEGGAFRISDVWSKKKWSCISDCKIAAKFKCKSAVELHNFFGLESRS